MRIVITGGAGFVGSSLAFRLQSFFDNCEIIVFDNLKRKGSELNLAKFHEMGIRFVHGDIRTASDLSALDGDFDVMIEASAEPSVTAGLGGSPRYLLDTNLYGTINCLELARRRCEKLVFLSTSRVYSIDPLCKLNLHETETRFEMDGNQEQPGCSGRGIAEEFPVDQPRSLYGASKLCSEILIQEYSYNYGLKAVVNRCGVIAGAGQFGKVDQGVFTLWVANHFFTQPLTYTGFGGNGKQVRDLLHPDDLFEAIVLQIENFEKYHGERFNLGGGIDISTSLLEYTEICREVTGSSVQISSKSKSNDVDIPMYISDCSKFQKMSGWSPKKKVFDIVQDIADWIASNEDQLKNLFVSEA